MALGRDELDRAVEDGLLTRAQADALWARADDREPPSKRAAAPDHLRAALAVGAGLVAAGVGAWLLVLASEQLGGAGAAAVALAEAVALAVGARLLERRGLPGPGGVLAGLAVALVPVAVRGVQAYLGLVGGAVAPPATLGEFLAGPDFPPALAGVLAAILALRLFEGPVLAAVAVAALWGAAMVAAPVVFGPAPLPGQRALLSAVVGLAAFACGVAVDGRTRRDHAYWLYLAGLVAFWGGLTTHHAASGASLLLGAVVNVALVFTSIALRRRVFAVFGGIGVAGVLGHCADLWLADPVVPFAFAAIAAGVVAAAVAYDRLAPLWERALPPRLPATIRRMLPPFRR